MPQFSFHHSESFIDFFYHLLLLIIIVTNITYRALTLGQTQSSNLVIPFIFMIVYNMAIIQLYLTVRKIKLREVKKSAKSIQHMNSEAGIPMTIVVLPHPAPIVLQPTASSVLRLPVLSVMFRL